jgi:hypothetical protein
MAVTGWPNFREKIAIRRLGILRKCKQSRRAPVAAKRFLQILILKGEKEGTI